MWKNRAFVMLHLVAQIAVELAALVVLVAIVAAQLNCYCASFYCYYIDYALSLDRESDDGVH